MVRKKHVMTIRVDDVELEAVESLAEDMGISKSEVWRRLLATVMILYSGNLALADALRRTDELAGIHKALKGSEVTLSDALRPLPELGALLNRRGGILIS